MLHHQPAPHLLIIECDVDVGPTLDLFPGCSADSAQLFRNLHRVISRTLDPTTSVCDVPKAGRLPFDFTTRFSQAAPPIATQFFHPTSDDSSAVWRVLFATSAANADTPFGPVQQNQNGTVSFDVRDDGVAWEVTWRCATVNPPPAGAPAAAAAADAVPSSLYQLLLELLWSGREHDAADLPPLQRALAQRAVDALKQRMPGNEARIDAIAAALIEPLCHSPGALYPPPQPGVLLYGAMGTGKSEIARALWKQVAGVECGFACAFDGFPNLQTNQYVGTSVNNLNRLFTLPRAFPRLPWILVMDEMDGTFRSTSKGEAGNDEARRATQMFMSILTDAECIPPRTFIVGSTNLISTLDARLTRPGRLGTHVFFGALSVDDLMRIIAHYLRRHAAAIPKPARDAGVDTAMWQGWVDDIEHMRSPAARTLAAYVPGMTPAAMREAAEAAVVGLFALRPGSPTPTLEQVVSFIIARLQTRRLSDSCRDRLLAPLSDAEARAARDRAAAASNALATAAAAAAATASASSSAVGEWRPATASMCDLSASTNDGAVVGWSNTAVFAKELGRLFVKPYSSRAPTGAAAGSPPWTIDFNDGGGGGGGNDAAAATLVAVARWIQRERGCSGSVLLDSAKVLEDSSAEGGLVGEVPFLRDVLPRVEAATAEHPLLVMIDVAAFTDIVAERSADQTQTAGSDASASVSLQATRGTARTTATGGNTSSSTSTAVAAGRSAGGDQSTTTTESRGGSHTDSRVPVVLSAGFSVSASVFGCGGGGGASWSWVEQRDSTSDTRSWDTSHASSRGSNWGTSITETATAEESRGSTWSSDVQTSQSLARTEQMSRGRQQSVARTVGSTLRLTNPEGYARLMHAVTLLPQQDPRVLVVLYVPSVPLMLHVAESIFLRDMWQCASCLEVASDPRKLRFSPALEAVVSSDDAVAYRAPARCAQCFHAADRMRVPNGASNYYVVQMAVVEELKVSSAADVDAACRWVRTAAAGDVQRRLLLLPALRVVDLSFLQLTEAQVQCIVDDVLPSHVRVRVVGNLLSWDFCARLARRGRLCADSASTSMLARQLAQALNWVTGVAGADATSTLYSDAETAAPQWHRHQPAPAIAAAGANAAPAAAAAATPDISEDIVLFHPAFTALFRGFTDRSNDIAALFWNVLRDETVAATYPADGFSRREMVVDYAAVGECATTRVVSGCVRVTRRQAVGDPLPWFTLLRSGDVVLLILEPAARPVAASITCGWVVRGRAVVGRRAINPTAPAGTGIASTTTTVRVAATPTGADVLVVSTLLNAQDLRRDDIIIPGALHCHMPAGFDAQQFAAQWAAAPQQQAGPQGALTTVCGNVNLFTGARCFEQNSVLTAFFMANPQNLQHFRYDPSQTYTVQGGVLRNHQHM